MYQRLSLFLVFSAILSLTACFSKYIYTDSELAKIFENKTLKPQYKWAEYADMKMHYAAIGNDSLPILLLVHGAPGAWYLFLNQFLDTAYTNNYKIIAVDRLGYGKSGYGKAETSTLVQTKLIAEVIKKEYYGKKIIALGRSYGAPIVGLLAVKNPEYFAKVIMISPVIDPNNEKFYWFSKLGKFKTIQFLLPKALNVATVEKYMHANEMKKIQLYWPQLNTQLYVFTGLKDKVASVQNFYFTEKEFSHLQNKKLQLLSKGSHFIMTDYPQLVYDAIKN